ncbi:MAG: hypothetical protein QME81_03490 [bacterium]|nr:hypothetical protein [bacterium]
MSIKKSLDTKTTWTIPMSNDQRVTNIRFSRHIPFLCALVNNSDPSGPPQSLFLWPNHGPGEWRVLPIPTVRPTGADRLRQTRLHDAIPSPDGTVIAAHVGREILLIDSTLGVICNRIDVGVTGSREIEFDDKGEVLASACSLDWPPLVVCDLNHGSVRRLEPPTDCEYSAHMPRLSVDANGQRVALAFNFGAAFIWDTRSGELTNELRLSKFSAGFQDVLCQDTPLWRSWENQFCRRLKLSADSKRIAWASFPAMDKDMINMGACLVDVQSGSRPRLCPVHSSMLAAELSPDLSLLICPIQNAPAKIGIWEMEHRTLLMMVDSGFGGVPLDIRWSPDGHWLAFGGVRGLTLMSVEWNVWSHGLDCALWRLRIGDTSCIKAVGHPDFTSRFDKVERPEMRSLDELLLIAQRICSELKFFE